MNAVNPVPSSIVPGDHSPTAEPSMEEILASIRRIIADDQSFPGRLSADRSASDIPREPPPRMPDADEADIAVLTGDESMQVLRTPSPERSAPHEAALTGIAEPASPSSEGMDSGHTAAPIAPEVAGTGSVAEALEEPTAPPHRLETEAPADKLFSPAVDSSVTAAFNALAASRLVANSDALMELTAEMIRPLLTAWIDKHLPDVIERLVAAEIDRIARGGP